MKKYAGRRKVYRRKRSMGKKRLYRKLRIARKFVKPDGVNAHKFTTTVDISWVATVQSNVIGWHGNVNTPAALQIFDTAEWANTSRLYEMYKTKGMRVVFEPIDFSNQPGNRTIKSVHIGSYTNASSAEAVAAVPGIPALS